MPNQPKIPPLKVRAIKATPVEVPLNFVLGTSQQALRQAPLLLIDLDTEESVTGRSYLFCYLRAAQPGIMSLLGEIESLAKGEPADPVALSVRLAQRHRLAAGGRYRRGPQIENVVASVSGSQRALMRRREFPI